MNLFRSSKSNRKTTICALLTIAAACAQAACSKDWSAVGASVTAALGLIFAQDA